MTPPVWRARRFLMVGQREVTYALCAGYRLEVVHAGQTLIARVEQQRAEDGAVLLLAEQRIDAMGGGGNLAGVARQIAALQQWAVTRARKLATRGR